MSTSADVDAAWLAGVWQHATFLAMNSQVYPYALMLDESVDPDLVRKPNIVNFFTCVCMRGRVPDMTQTHRQMFELVVTRYLQQTDSAQSTFLTVRDQLEAIDDLARTQIGNNWSGTVLFERGSKPSKITPIIIDGVKCWQGSLTYQAEKQI